MEFISFAAITTALKNCYEMCKELFRKLIPSSRDMQEKMTTLIDKVSDLQATVLNERTQWLKIQEENESLKKQLQEKTQWDEIKTHYVIEEIAPLSYAYAAVDENGNPVAPYYCVDCFSKNILSILAPNGMYSNIDGLECKILICNTCNAHAYLKTGKKAGSPYLTGKRKSPSILDGY